MQSHSVREITEPQEEFRLMAKNILLLDSKKVTGKLKWVLAIVDDFSKERGYCSLTNNQIAEHIGDKHPKNINRDLKQLEKPDSEMKTDETKITGATATSLASISSIPSVIPTKTDNQSKKDKLDPAILTEDYLDRFFRDNKDYFPNFGGDIENLLVQCKFCHSRRVIGQPPRVRCIFTKDDLTNGFDRFKVNRSKELDKRKGFKDAFEMMVM